MFYNFIYKKRGSKAGFSLVELLVVIAIIAILISMIVPLYKSGLSRGHLITCQRKMQGLTQAWTAYAVENDGMMVSSNNSPTNERPAWVARPSSFNKAGQDAAIKNGALWAYVRDINMYKCPTPLYEHYSISYSISAMLNGEQTRRNSSRGAVSMGEVNEPGSTLVMIEEDDARGWLHNSWMIDPQSYTWVDFVPGNHMLGDNLTFADGHVEYWKWQDPRTLTIYQNSNHHQKAPGSVDLDRLAKVFKPRRIL